MSNEKAPKALAENAERFVTVVDRWLKYAISGRIAQQDLDSMPRDGHPLLQSARHSVVAIQKEVSKGSNQIRLLTPTLVVELEGAGENPTDVLKLDHFATQEHVDACRELWPDLKAQLRRVQLQKRRVGVPKDTPVAATTPLLPHAEQAYRSYEHGAGTLHENPSLRKHPSKKLHAQEVYNYLHEHGTGIEGYELPAEFKTWRKSAAMGRRHHEGAPRNASRRGRECRSAVSAADRDRPEPGFDE